MGGGSHALTELPEPTQLASISRALAGIALNVPWLEELPPPHIEAMLCAAGRAVNPAFGKDDIDVLHTMSTRAQHHPELGRGFAPANVQPVAIDGRAFPSHAAAPCLVRDRRGQADHAAVLQREAVREREAHAAWVRVVAVDGRDTSGLGRHERNSRATHEQARVVTARGVVDRGA